MLDELIAGGVPVVLAFWHGDYPVLCPLLCGRKAHVLTSRSPRGDAIADFARRFGYTTVQIPDRGPEHSLEFLRRAVAGCPLVAVAVDGPRGPRRAVKPGVVQLAAEAGYLLVPAAIAAHRLCLALGPHEAALAAGAGGSGDR
jgi:lysophospholipid acyltransferase (LPLAT)-like uncharacterized protein